MRKGPYLPDIMSIIAAGLDPRTGLPIKLAANASCGLKDGIKNLLQIIDRQDAVRRYKWYNLPDGLNSELIERILYYRGQGCFFYLPEGENGRFLFLPYALNGSIDVYGRFTAVRPLAFQGEENAREFVKGLSKEVQYEVFTDEITEDDIKGKCVLLSDYAKGITQTVISRSILQQPIIEVESDIIPYMRTALRNSTGIAGIRVNTQDEQSNVQAANASVEKAVLSGEKYIPIVGNIDFQDLPQSGINRSEEFLLAMQSIDNFRLQCLGIENAGLFEKKAHITNAENAVNGSNIGLIMQDGLTQRQEFCDIVNSIWGLGIYCEISETVTEYDENGDGLVEDNQDQSGTNTGTQDVSDIGEENDDM